MDLDSQVFANLGDMCIKGFSDFACITYLCAIKFYFINIGALPNIMRSKLVDKLPSFLWVVLSRVKI